MTSTYSPSLRLDLQAGGDNYLTWGDVANGDFTMIDAAISGLVNISIPDADVVLTANNGAADQARAMILTATGTTTAIRNLIVPAVSKVYIVYNGTSFQLGVKTSTGTAALINPSARAIVYCDGTNCFAANAGTFVNLSGDTMTGALTSTQFNSSGGIFASTTVNSIFAGPAGGTVFLRPNGSASTTGQITFTSANASVYSGNSIEIKPIISSDSAFFLSKFASGRNSILYGRTGTSARWTMALGNSTAESANSGSDFDLHNFNDSAVDQGSVLFFSRLTGLGTIKGDPTAALGIATKQYVDAVTTNVTTNYLPLAGGTLTGQLVGTAGTAAAPSLAIGATNTGMFGSAASIKYSVGGTNRLTLSTTQALFTVPATLPADPVNALDAATKQYTDAGDLGKVSKTGDTMSGVLTIQTTGTTWPQINFIKPASGVGIQFVGYTGNTSTGSRWSMSFGDQAAESGSNAGSDFNVSRYDDTGTWIDAPLNITRSTGNIDLKHNANVYGNFWCGGTGWFHGAIGMDSTLTLAADPTTAMQAATKQYVDAHAGSGGGGGTVTAVTGTAPVVSSGGTAPAISMPTATTSVDGYLAAVDWTTFNAKAPTASPTFTGTATFANTTATGTVNVPTVSPPTSSTIAASTAYVTNAVSTAAGNYVPKAGGTMTGALSLPATGTATASMLNFGTANTGYYGTANDMSFTVGGTRQIYVGSVGISLYSNLTTATPAAGVASLTLPHGVAPSAPGNGDMWTTTAGLYARINAVTYGPAIFGVSVVAPITSSGGIAPQLSMAAATTSVNGYLTSTDWTTFNNKAPTANPTFTGTVTLPTGTVGVTQTAGNSSTALATTAFVATSFAPLASPTFTGAPNLPTGAVGVTQTAGNSTTALATTAFVTTADNLKANLASPTFTGTPAAPTPVTTDNSTTIATTAFVKAAIAGGSTTNVIANISDTAPGSPVNGQLWWCSADTNLYIYYNDGNSSQWVQVNVAGS